MDAIRGGYLLDLLLIALGGAAGSVLRHGLTRLAVSLPGGASTWGTLAANVLGCLFIGVLAGMVSSGGAISERQQLALRAGLLGGLTTFSTFALESVALADQHRWFAAVANVLVNLVLGISAVVAGALIGRNLIT